MSCYSIPAMSMENEFSDLGFVSRYVDDLVERTGDLDYSIVYEWGEGGPGGWPPVAVLARLDGRWWRRAVLVSTKQQKDGACAFDFDLDRAELKQDVNGH